MSRPALGGAQSTVRLLLTKNLSCSIALTFQGHAYLYRQCSTVLAVQIFLVAVIIITCGNPWLHVPTSYLLKRIPDVGSVKLERTSVDRQRTSDTDKQ